MARLCKKSTTRHLMKKSTGTHHLKKCPCGCASTLTLTIINQSLCSCQVIAGKSYQVSAGTGNGTWTLTRLGASNVWTGTATGITVTQYSDATCTTVARAETPLISMQCLGDGTFSLLMSAISGGITVFTNNAAANNCDSTMAFTNSQTCATVTYVAYGGTATITP